MANIIRQDVVQIGFDTDFGELTKLNNEINNLKRQFSGGMGDDAFDDMAQGAQKAKKGVSGVTDGVQDLASTSLSAINGGLDKMCDHLTNIAKKAAGAAYSGLKKLASISFKGLIAGMGAVGALVGASVTSYASFEQLEGGVQTLFGAGGQTIEEYAKSAGKTVKEVKSEYDSLIKAQTTVFNNADSAYSRAGMSANDYMETVTGFSASLISSLDGDTVKAAELADKAIVDMSDNANKIGTDMGLIQNAYQGFAKQNYTMLDNLKLGYGGTQEEMKRLIKDAAKLDKSVDANSMSFDNIVKAIHAVQENMGIAGATSAEAATTIEGSLKSMKAALGNLLPALVSGGDEFDRCVDNLVSSVKTFAGNIMPAIKKALSGVGDLITELVPMIAKELPVIIADLLPSLANAGVQIVVEFGKSIVDNAPQLLKAVKEVIGIVVKAIYKGFTGKEMSGDMFSQLQSKVDTAFSAIGKIISGVVQFAQQMMSALAPVLAFVGDLALNVFTWIGDNINWLLPLVTGLVGAFWAYKAAMVAVKTVTTVVSAAQKIMGVTSALLAGKLPLVAAGTKAAGTASATSATQISTAATAFMKMGVGVLAIGGGIALVALGFALLTQSAIALANAGWGAIAVMLGMVAAIAALAFGASLIGAALTAGAVGFLAFGGAVALVGAGFALIGVGALLAATSLQMIAAILPIITQYGLMGSLAITALGLGLTVFAIGAALAGAAAIVLGAGLLVVAAALLVIVASLVIATATLAIMAALSTVLALNFTIMSACFALMSVSALQLSAALLPLTVVFTALTVPLLIFTATITPLTALFVLLAASATVFLVAVSALLLVLTGIAAMTTMINMQFLLLSVMFTVVSAGVMAFVMSLTPLSTVLLSLVPSVMAFTIAITPLTLLFVALGASALVFTASMTALSVVFVLLNAMVLMFTATMALLPALMMATNVMALMLTMTFTMLATTMTALSGSMLVITPALLLFTAALLPLSGVMLLLMPTTLVFTATLTALMAVMLLLAPTALLFSTAMLLLAPAMEILGRSTPIFAAALTPLTGLFLALVVPVGLLAAALAPLAGEFAVLAASATALFVATAGLVTTTMMLSVLFVMIATVSKQLITTFLLLGTTAMNLSTAFAPLSQALLSMCSPLSVVSSQFMKFALASMSAVNSSKALTTTFMAMIAVTQLLSSGFTKLVNVVRLSCATMVSVMVQSLRQMENAVSQVNLTSEGAQMIDGLIRGMNSRKAAAISTARSIAQAINREYRKAQDINSPSGEWENYGAYQIQGDIKGMEKEMPNLKSAVQEAGDVSVPYMDRYSPESTTSYTTSRSAEYNSYAPQFSFSVSGTNDDRAIVRKIKRAVAEAWEDMLSDYDSKTPQTQEV